MEGRVWATRSRVSAGRGMTEATAMERSRTERGVRARERSTPASVPATRPRPIQANTSNFLFGESGRAGGIGMAFSAGEASASSISSRASAMS